MNTLLSTDKPVKANKDIATVLQERLTGSVSGDSGTVGKMSKPCLPFLCTVLALLSCR